jgi:hypothetical protein
MDIEEAQEFIRNEIRQGHLSDRDFRIIAKSVN